MGTVILMGLFSCPSFGDSLVLRSGRHVHGHFAGGTQGVIAFVADGVPRYYNVTDILLMTFEPEDGGTDGGQSVAPQLPEVVPGLHPQRSLHKVPTPRLKAVDKLAPSKAPARSPRADGRVS
jgi:hypothetical protein